MNSMSIDPPKLSIDPLSIHDDRSTQTVDRSKGTVCRLIHQKSRSIDFYRKQIHTPNFRKSDF
jgi:hypothetical protein